MPHPATGWTTSVVGGSGTHGCGRITPEITPAYVSASIETDSSTHSRSSSSPAARSSIGPVAVRGGPVASHEAAHVDVEQVDEFGLDAVVAARVEQYWRELFFRKDLDWASEHEYRWVVLTNEPAPLFVDVSDCVHLIVLGDSFPAARLPSVRHAAQSMTSAQIVTIKYRNGRPMLLPATDGSGRSRSSPPPCWRPGDAHASACRRRAVGNQRPREGRARCGASTCRTLRWSRSLRDAARSS